MEDEAKQVSRRGLLGIASRGLAAAAAAGLTLRADAVPTPVSGALHEGSFAFPLAIPVIGGAPAAATEINILGPFYRGGAPYRAKVTPPLEPGRALVVRGRVWSHASRQPAPHSLLDVWQANAAGRYDNDDPTAQPGARIFYNRARMIADESGYYEFETIHPGAYKTDPNTWRPCHIHFRVSAPGMKMLVTQLYFEGDRYNAGDQFIKPSLIRPVRVVAVNGQEVEVVTFDIVLESA